MKSNFKIVVAIIVLLLFMSILLSFVNYHETLNLAQEQIKKQSLPLSLDNIYTDIQKYIIEPYLISSLMANDTFVQNWLKFDEKNVEKIIHYLNTIKKKYGNFTTFLVSENTKKYYTNNGFLEVLNKKNKDNKWYFDFVKINKANEINLDYNNRLADSLLLFINYKIFDRNNNLLGVTGVSQRMIFIDEMLEKFKNKYHVNVYIFNKEGKIILGRKDKINNYDAITDFAVFKLNRKKIITKKAVLFEYNENGETYILNTKYIPELDLYILAQAKLSSFTGSVVNTFYFNLIVSLSVTFFIALIIVFLIKKYNKRLENLAEEDMLTNLINRRGFIIRMEMLLKLSIRNKRTISVLFADIDDFKIINDNMGHQTGDNVLKRVAQILKENIRESDLVARWGGEEFIIALMDTDINSALLVAEKLRSSMENDSTLYRLSGKKLTGSFGVTINNKDDDLDTLISRADEGMYKAKESGKNCIRKVL